MHITAPSLPSLTRRSLITGAAALILPLPALASTLKLNDDGLYTKPWFLELSLIHI